ncbi:methionine--tRNA ligase [Candidatus Parcubacteria bacterium]|nr:MAG: methionine--tRNA ligase [Candidatus Parcubacteria bacterium]
MTNTGGNKFYITTAIDYVNGAPHIGHALEKIQADVIARWQRSRGKAVWFLTGTDEHGSKIARRAAEVGKEPQAFADENAAIFRDLKKVLDLSWDDFIRTTDRERHWPGVEKLWRALAAAGDIYKKRYGGLYCIGHEGFVTEKDLVNGKCPDHGTAPEAIAEENWFFRLSKYGPQIKRRIESGELAVHPQSRANEILALIDQGLEDVSFSRPRETLSWGIPVPDDPTQTIYVWCDALANYLTAVGYGRDDANFARWWPADLHVIGKDILRFHAAIWPGMLLAAGIPLPRAILVHGFLNVEGQKISKTLGNVIAPGDIVREYGTDPVRYYLLRDVPVGEDGNFSRAVLKERYNGDLANGLGNLVARVGALAEKAGPLPVPSTHPLADAVAAARAGRERALGAYKFNEALAAVWSLIGAADRYLNETKPWTLDGAELARAIAPAALAVAALAELIEPFLPSTAAKIAAGISREGDILVIRKGEGLFPRLA